ncbi:LysM peptidoglycan-binding domain-containing protein [Enterococcus casseliflavus]|uniref:LysM peptidoglycan-binding domain-containing protein n=1 Tax=Enterococcus casseliflavus TaxID=37734 RepID=UPI001432F047|nr:LysM domain-containing protein [Enterococcus casseliflavus]NKD39772.1 LysM peptidoglycan-binding domain-containing protein [Enterococcus casseliflavus]
MKILKVLAIGITVGGMALAIHTEKAEAAEWTPRSSEQIKAEISGNKYTIVWGDTLSAISEATNITVEKLAEWNSISNVDLIFAGNTISWDGNVATMENAQGDTISQAVIQETPADRVDPTKPIGGGTGSNTSNNGSNGSGNTNNTTNPPSSNDNGSGNGNGTVTPPAGGDNGSSDNGTTTPPTGGDNGTGGGGTDVTPPTGGDNGTGGEETPEQELYRVTPLGNSGMEFDTNIEAAEWGLAQTMDPESPWFGMRSTSKPLFWSNGEVLSYSVDFY